MRKEKIEVEIGEIKYPLTKVKEPSKKQISNAMKYIINKK